MLNHIVIMGRLTKDPELRTTQSGVSVTSFTLAVDRDFKNKDSGEKSTDFIDVVAWRQTAEFVCKYFSKGRMAVAEGRLQIRDWKDRDGNNRRSAEVVADNVYGTTAAPTTAARPPTVCPPPPTARAAPAPPEATRLPAAARAKGFPIWMMTTATCPSRRRKRRLSGRWAKSNDARGRCQETFVIGGYHHGYGT